MSRPRISLLHATYRRHGGPLEVRDAWLGRAVDPASVEYVLSMDADDSATVALTEGVPRLVNPAWPWAVTAVRNWNAAAAAANGDLLVVIADDLFPPQGWDQALLQVIGGLNPRRASFVVKVADDPRPRNVILRHPVVSRAFYTRFGLFSPAYHGVYCDDDFTTRAFWRSVILDGRTLRFDHRHPAWSVEVAHSESHERLNSPDEYSRGEARYRSTWSRREREARPRLLSTGSPASLRRWQLVLAQRGFRTLANLEFTARALRQALTSS